MVPTCKNVALYSSTSLNVGTMVNAPLVLLVCVLQLSEKNKRNKKNKKTKRG